MNGKENHRYFSYFHFILFIVQRKRGKEQAAVKSAKVWWKSQ